MTQRIVAEAHARPVGSLTGRQWLGSLACALMVAAGWGLFMRSVWVGVVCAVLAILPLWWTPREQESFANRFRFALLAGGLAASIQLGVTLFAS
jgi:hypothetical protein